MSVDIRPAMVALLPRLRAFARALARSGDTADDLVQATCEKAMRAVDSWTPGTRLDSWMFRIMQNHWIDAKRRERPLSQLDAHSADELMADDGVQAIEARLTLESVMQVIDRMPENQRLILVLVCVEGLSYREAAEALEIPIGTVMSRLARARRTMIDTLGLEHEGVIARSGGSR